MTVFAFGSVKASPGVTTAVLALAAAWPADRCMVVELDLDGGDVAAWYDVAAQPGLRSYAAAGRCDLRPYTVLAHPAAAGAGWLAKLRLAGLVNGRREGTFVYDSTADVHVRRLLVCRRRVRE